MFYIFVVIVGSVGICVSEAMVSGVSEVDDRFPQMKQDVPWMLEFYAPWCGHCKKLVPVYERLASELDGTDIRVAKIDGTRYPDVTSLYDIRGFPSILFIKGDTVHEYRGDRTVEKLKQFAIRANSAAVHEVESESSFIMLKQREETFFVYVGEENTASCDRYKKVARNYSLRADFYTASEARLSKSLRSTRYPAVFVVKSGTPYLYPGTLDSIEELSVWVNREKFGLMPTIEGADFYDVMSLNKYLVIVVASSNAKLGKQAVTDSKRLIESVMPLASSEVSEKFQFVKMEDTGIADNILLTSCPTPYLFAFNPENHEYFLPDFNLSLVATTEIQSFLTDVLDGKVVGLGGTGPVARAQRMWYSFITSALALWKESKILFCLVGCMPCAILSLFAYTLCCATWDEDEQQPMKGGDNSEEELETDEDEEEPDDDGHLKKE